MKKIILLFISTLILLFSGITNTNASCVVNSAGTETCVGKPNICTQEYAPVCGQLPGSNEYKTYSNRCYLEKAGAKFLYSGECKTLPGTICAQDVKQCSSGIYVSRTGPNCEFQCSPVIEPNICTQEYAPVCGQPKMFTCPEGVSCAHNAISPVQPKTYSNRCYLEKAGAKFLYMGKCRDDLPYEMKKKVDSILEKLYKKLDDKFSYNKDKIEYLEGIIDKLNIIYNKSPKYQSLIIYIKNNISNKIDYYNDDLDIFDILK